MSNDDTLHLNMSAAYVLGMVFATPFPKVRKLYQFEFRVSNIVSINPLTPGLCSTSDISYTRVLQEEKIFPVISRSE